MYLSWELWLINTCLLEDDLMKWVTRLIYWTLLITTDRLTISQLAYVQVFRDNKAMQILWAFVLSIALLIIPKVVIAETLEIEFTENDSYSIEVARIDVGDTIEWLPKNEGHNVEFFAGPEISLPPKSEMDEPHSVVFSTPGVYLYGCTPHANMGMLGLIIVGNDLHNLDSVKQTELSPIGRSVLKRLVRIAGS